MHQSLSIPKQVFSATKTMILEVSGTAARMVFGYVGRLREGLIEINTDPEETPSKTKTLRFTRWDRKSIVLCEVEERVYDIE